MNLKEFFTPEVIQKLISAAIGISLFFITYGIIKKLLGKFAYPKLKQNTAFLLKKGIKYGFYVLLIIYILGLFNVKLTALFGAAGIAGIAIGFAAQTSVSNIISGLFLLTEHSLKVGDYITVNGESGTIDSIDMLSVRIHTADNQFIRIPNETIINANLKNNSYFDLRRYSLNVAVSYETDLKKAIEVLQNVPTTCDLAVTDPAPQVFVDNFGDSGINLTLAAWTKNGDYLAFKNQLFVAVKENFDKNNIEIPYNKLVLVK